ncbi:MAG TPA: DUF885 domain-containing protein [Thermoanaerobaculia bacterium]|nr:DUF885 domain-containing protein [Thermoanaerobaculia bacterium]
MTHRFVPVAAVVLVLLVPGVCLAGEYEEKRAEVLTVLAALESNEEGLSESERLERYVDVFFDYSMNEYPEFATYLGIPRGQDRWSDNSLAAEERREQDMLRGLDLLESFDRSALAADERLDYDLLLDDLRSAKEGMRFSGELLAINQMSGVHSQVAQLVAITPARSVGDYENLLARLEKVPTLVDNTLARLEKGLEQGVTPPRVTLRDLPQQVRNLVVEEPLASPLLAAFTRFPDAVSAADRERLTAAAAVAYRDGIAPAFTRLADFLEETYVPGARETIAMKDLPEGEAWYAYRVREMTTTEMAPQQVHDIGLAEVARIRGEMDRVIAASGFEGSFEEFTEFLRTDPRFYFESGEELLAAYRDIAKRADAELPKLFATLPRLPYGIQAVPEFKEKSSTTAYYEPGSIDAGRAGTFFANTYALDQRPSWEMEALTLHEAVPGHHLQIALSFEQDELPWFRRYGGETAFTEGWGLYAESLGEEMGFYQDPYSKFGQLTYEIWRAIRLVVDTGMHSLGWSREQAIDYFRANSGKAEHDIVVEIDRYIVWPGQALAYKIGELKIRELRARTADALGDDFDVRAFHDAVLANGALPLAVLETRIDEWIAERKGPEPPAVDSLG